MYNNYKLEINMEVLYKCQKCNKDVFVQYGSGKFCSRACANSRVLSTETKIKISKSSAKTTGGRSKYDLQFCKECGKVLSRRNQTGYCYLCNLKSSALRERRVIAGKKAYKTMVEHGTHHGWQTRDQISYAEQFFMEVLFNNNINYIHEKPVRKLDGINNYFLDFYIEANDLKIDLEIDGKQHNYQDRSESDLIRDEYLKSLGYTIYRISWNEINSVEGKTEMKEKISKFIKFYNSLLA